MKNKLLIITLVMMILLVGFVSAIPTAPDSSDTVVYYTFDNDEVSGSTLTDTTLNGYDAINTGAATSGATGIYLEAFDFDGTNDYLVLPTNAAIDNQIMSVCIWFKRETTNTQETFYFKGHDTGYQRNSFFISDSNDLIYLWFGTSSSSAGIFASTTTVADTDWHFTCFARDATNMDIYLDGNIENTDTYSGYYVNDNDYLQIGGYYESSSANRRFDGILDEVSIFNVRLTEDEMDYLWNLGSPGEIQQWNFTGGSDCFDITNTNSVNNMTAYFNSTSYSTTNGTINTGIESTEEFTIIMESNEGYYFNNTYTNYNISSDLSVTFTESPRVTVYDNFSLAVLSGFNVTYDSTTISDVVGVAYMFLNESKNITIAKTNYFSKTLLHNFSGATDLNTSLYQAIISINITERFSGNPISNWVLYNDSTVLINTTESVDTFYAIAGNYSNLVLHSNTGAFSDSNIDSFSVSALDNKTVYYELLPTEMNVTAINILSGDNIQNFSITYSSYNSSHSGSFFCTDGDIIFGVINSDTYNITIDAPSYALWDNSINKVISGDSDHEFSLYTNNSINFEVRWEENNSLITNLTNICLTGGLAVYNFNTSNGTHYADNIIDGTYSVKASIDGLEDKYYSVTVSDRSHQELTVYFAESYNNVTFLFQDKTTGTTLEGVYFSMSRYVNGTLTVVSSKLSDITGAVAAKYVPGTFYQLSVLKDGYSEKTFELDPIESSLYIVKMISADTQIYINDGVSIYYSPKTFTNGSNNFTFTINSPLGLLSSYWLNVSYPGGYTNLSGSEAIGEVFDFDFVIVNPSIYDSVRVGYYYLTSLSNTDNPVYYHPINYINASSTAWSNISESYGDLGIFERIIIVVLGVILMAGFGHLMGGAAGSLILGLLVYVFFVVTGFIPLWSILISLFVGLIIVLRGGSFG